MLQTKVAQIYVNSNTAAINAYLSSSGCACTCANCSGCTDCVNCPSLITGNPPLYSTQIAMKIYRKGTEFVCGNAIPTPQQYPNCTNPPNNTNGPCPTPTYPNAPPPPTYFLMYYATNLVGTLVTFNIDSQLTGLCPGQYQGDIFISGNPCGNVRMNVGNSCSVFAPFTTPVGTALGADLQP